MSTTKITSQLMRFLHSLNRFKEVYIEEREIIGEPLFEGLPELRIREKPDGTYQVNIKGSDVSFTLDSLLHYFKELGFVGLLIYSSIKLPKACVIESLFFSDSDYMKFQEVLDYIEYDSSLDEVLESTTELILGVETEILFTHERLQVSLPEEVLLTSKLKKMLTDTRWRDDTLSSEMNADRIRNEASLTPTLTKLMSVDSEIQRFAEYVLGTAWYDMMPRTESLIRFEPVVRKIPEIHAYHDSGENCIVVVHPLVDVRNKFITKILDFFENNIYHLEQESYRLLLKERGLITVECLDSQQSFRMEDVVEIVESGIQSIFGDTKKYKLRKYGIKVSEKEKDLMLTSEYHSLGYRPHDKMSMTTVPAIAPDESSMLTGIYPEEYYYELDLEDFLSEINSSGALDVPLSLEELEVLLFINERKSKKVQSNIIMKKLGLKKEKAKELLKKLSDQGWFKVSHGWYSLRPSKAKLLEEILEAQKHSQLASSRELEETQSYPETKTLKPSARSKDRFDEMNVKDLTREEMKSLLLREKMEKEFNEDIEDEYYEMLESSEVFDHPFTSAEGYEYEWDAPWERDLSGYGSDVAKLKTVDQDVRLEVGEVDLVIEDPGSMSVLDDLKSKPVDEETFELENRNKISRVTSTTSLERSFMEDLSEEEMLFLKKKRMDSLKLERVDVKQVKKRKKPVKETLKVDEPLVDVKEDVVKETVDISRKKVSLNDHLASLSIAGFTDEEIQVILALLNYKENKMVFKSLVKHTTLKKTRLKKIVKELVKKGVIKRLRGDYVTIDYESPNPNLQEVLKIKDLLNQRKTSIWNIELSEDELKIVKAMARHKEYKAQSNSVAEETGLPKQKTREILRKFAVAGICNVTRGWYALNERSIRLVLGEKRWEEIKRECQPPMIIPYPKVPLTDDEKLVYDAIRSQKSLKAQSNLIARKTGLDRDKIRSVLRNLVDKGVLKVKHGWYCIIPPES